MTCNFNGAQAWRTPTPMGHRPVEKHSFSGARLGKVMGFLPIAPTLDSSPACSRRPQGDDVQLQWGTGLENLHTNGAVGLEEVPELWRNQEGQLAQSEAKGRPHKCINSHASICLQR